MANLPDEFSHVQREYHLPPGDFPDPGKFKQILESFDLSAFPKLDKKMLKTIDEVWIPRNVCYLVSIACHVKTTVILELIAKSSIFNT